MQSYHNVRIVCVFVCHTPLVPSALHSCESRLWHLSSWALGTYAHTLAHRQPEEKLR